jgi:hypothetical protein
MNTMKTMVAVAAFALATGNVKAAIGWSLEECKQYWGPIRSQSYSKIGHRLFYHFEAKGYHIAVGFLNVNRVSRVYYQRLDGRELSRVDIADLLHANAPDANWLQPVKSDDMGKIEYEWDVPGFCAIYEDNVLQIFTDEDSHFAYKAHERASQGL